MSRHETFIRKNMKFLLPLHKLDAFLSFVSEHLELDVHMDPRTKSQQVSSLYLDNAQYEMYHRRLAIPRGSLIRVRWYETEVPNFQNGYQNVFLERKTYIQKEKENNNQDEKQREEEVLAIKQRIPLPFKQEDTLTLLGLKKQKEKRKEKDGLLAFIPPLSALKEGKRKWLKRLYDGIVPWKSGERHARRDNKRLEEEIGHAILQKQLMPILRVVVLRSAFQYVERENEKGRTAVRITIDRQMKIGWEQAPLHQGQWFNHYFLPVYEFPYAIIEIKVMNTSVEEAVKHIPWLSALILWDNMLAIDDFSKFLFGLFYLHSQHPVSSSCPIVQPPFLHSFYKFDATEKKKQARHEWRNDEAGEDEEEEEEEEEDNSVQNGFYSSTF